MLGFILGIAIGLVICIFIHFLTPEDPKTLTYQSWTRMSKSQRRGVIRGGFGRYYRWSSGS